MRSIVPLAGAAGVLLVLAGPVLAQPTLGQPKDPAELFPAQTLAYLEVRQPERLSRELASLIKGSALEDLAAVFAQARTARGDNPDDFGYGGMMFSQLGLLLSPEALAEFGRVGGGAVAITGWNKDEGPEVVGVIYPGESNLVMMYFRTFLAADYEMRIAEKVEGVNLYRARGRDYSVPIPPSKPGEPRPQPPIRDKGPTFAVMPGMAIIASTPRAAREVVRRAKGKVSEPALSSLGAFKRAASQREKANVFAFADVSALAAQIDNATATPTPGPGRRNSDWAVMKALFNPRGLGTAVATASLQNGNIDCRLQVQVDDKQPSPLLELLSDKKATLDGLHFAPKDGMLTVTLPWTDGAARWEKLLALIDGMARADGAPDERLPSKEIGAAEQKVGITLGKDVFARVAGVTLTVDMRHEPGSDGPPVLLALTAKDEDAAKALEDLVPKVMALSGKGEAAPGTVKVAGQSLQTYPAANMPWRAPLYYGREGKTLVLGQTKEGVAASLAGGARKGGLLGEAKVAAVLKGTDDALVVGTCSIGESLAQMVNASRPRVMVKPAGPPETNPKPPKEGPSEDERVVKEMRQAVAPLAPTVMTLSRKGDLVVLEMKQTGLKTVSAKAINVLIDAAAREMMTPRVHRSDGPLPPDAIPDKP